MTEGYKALTRAAAVIDLSSRTRIRATGEDRARLLHALTTNHIQQLLPGHGCYAFFLNAQGRVLADANLLVFAEHILIDTEPDLLASLWNHIDHYIIADDVNLHDDAGTTFCLSVEGPQAEERLTQLGAPTPSNDFEHAPWRNLTVARVHGYRIFGPQDEKELVLAQLYLIEATAEDADAVRIEQGRPLYGKDITIARLAAETGQTHALHFQKGCYLGQEIVERVRSRGHVNRQLVSIELESAPPPGSKILFEGVEIGELTSSTPTGKFALGYVRIPHEKPGTILEIAGIKAQTK